MQQQTTEVADCEKKLAKLAGTGRKKTVREKVTMVE
jgi:hypothetical protein